ncbi:MAG TPA: amidohydrolase, partial [Flavobacteriales bacterium]|nr:amidohydrolase [Flavobacteriales bacterium]
MKEEVDLIIRNAKIYTVDNNFSIINEMAIHNGKIVAVGTTNQVLDDYTSANIINTKARFIYPGFIDAHCHFLGYGLSLQQVNLSGTNSFEEVIDKVVAFSKENKSDWITGRG